MKYNVRNRYDNATHRTSAWCVVDGPTLVGRLVVTGRSTATGHCCRAFFHIFGHPMSEGVARGGGYDMVSAAIGAAISASWPMLAVHERAQLAGIIEKLESSALHNWQPVARWSFIRAI